MHWFHRHRLALAAIVAILGVILWQRALLTLVSREQITLTASVAEAERLSTENGQLTLQLQAAHPPNPVPAELLRLRNEVQSLRSTAHERDQLRADNARLAAPPGPDALQAQWLASPAYVARTNWAEAGLETPEAAIRTFFRALRDQDVPRMLSCLSDQGSRALNLRTNSAGDLRPDAQETMQALGAVPGFRIEHQEFSAADKALLDLRAVAQGKLLHLKLRQTEGQWKIDGP